MISDFSRFFTVFTLSPGSRKTAPVKIQICRINTVKNREKSEIIRDLKKGAVENKGYFFFTTLNSHYFLKCNNIFLKKWTNSADKLLFVSLIFFLDFFKKLRKIDRKIVPSFFPIFTGFPPI